MVPACADNLLGYLVLGIPSEEWPRSSLPMREPSIDQHEGNEQRCCISSDAEGRILTTSFPLFSHPLSVRPVPEIFYHFERFGSENTGTAIAQVGRAISPVPSSQKIENFRWRKWLDQPSSPISSHVAVDGSRSSLEQKVSPGVSEIRLPRQQPSRSSPSKGHYRPNGSRNASSEESCDPKLASSSDSSEILDRYEELVARLRRLEQFDTPLPRDQLSPPALEKPTVHTAHGIEKSNAEVTTLPSSRVRAASSVLIGAVENRRGDSSAISDAENLGLEHIPASLPSSLPPLAIQQDCAASDETDPAEAWKAFVFGDEQSDEISKAAFEDAKQDALRDLRPSDSPSASYDNPETEGSNAATIGTSHTFHGNETPESMEAPSSTGAAPSLEIAGVTSATATESRPVADTSDGSAHAPSIEVNAGTSSLSEIESSIHTSENIGPVSVEETDSNASEAGAGAPSMATSTVVAPALSHVGAGETKTKGEQFRFALPKLFVGSRSNFPQHKRTIEPRVGISLAKRRGRPKKRVNDGRADIRALPTYSSDPIEEFEEEERGCQEGRVPKSRFPALELA